MRSREYRVLRQAGLLAASKYRARVAECDRILARGGTFQHACKWMVSRDDWARMLHTERVLLRELRRPNGIYCWLAAVIEMRPKGTVALLFDTGVDKPAEMIHRS